MSHDENTRSGGPSVSSLPPASPTSRRRTGTTPSSDGATTASSSPGPAQPSPSGKARRLENALMVCLVCKEQLPSRNRIGYHRRCIPKLSHCIHGHEIKKKGRHPINGRCYACAREARRQWRIEQKKWAVTQKGGSCVDCLMEFGDRYECAQFDHTRGRTIPREQDIMTFSRARLVRELAECDLVCANCHATRTRRRLEETLSVREVAA